MGQGLWHKECHNDILHPGLKFSDDLGFCTVWFTNGLQKLDKASKFLGKSENELRGFFYLQFGSKYDYLHHAHIIMCSRI